MRKIRDFFRRNREPYSTYACVADNRWCGRPSLPDDIVCAEHARDEPWEVNAPRRIFPHFRFAQSAQHGYGKIILDGLLQEGVHQAHRTLDRQYKLYDLYLEEQRRGLQLFGTKGITPNVCIQKALMEMEEYGYRILQPPHVLDCDAVYAAEDPERIGERVVVLMYEYAPEEISVPMPELIQPLIVRPWMHCWPWINIPASDGSQVHCIEMVGFQFEVEKPFCHLTFSDSLWLPELAA